MYERVIFYLIFHQNSAGKGEKPLATPSQLVEKAKQNREMRILRQNHAHERSIEEPRVSPAAFGGHANYSRLMRSHDRMRTRHLSKSEIGHIG